MLYSVDYIRKIITKTNCNGLVVQLRNEKTSKVSGSGGI